MKFPWTFDTKKDEKSRVYSPSKFQVLNIYLKRTFTWRSNSEPFLSGDAIADNCDFVFNPPRYRSFSSQRIPIESALSIFVSGTDLTGFLEQYHSRINARVLLVGNSDQEFHNISENLPTSVRKIYIQNSFISNNSSIETLPIGIENLRWGINGKKKFLHNILTDSKKEKKVMIGPFGNTHPLRSEVVEKFRNLAGAWDVFDGYRKPTDLAGISSNYRYIACVRGNGVDTHRLWETLYRVNFPIVKIDDWSTSLSKLNLPIIFVKDWSPDDLEQAVSQGDKLEAFNPHELKPLWIEYWTEQIQKACFE